MVKSLTKKELENLKKKPRIVWDTFTNKERTDCLDFCENYKTFLNTAKTEREAVVEIIRLAKKTGFTDIDKKTAGQCKFYKIFNNKAVVLSVSGKRKMTDGLNIIGSHLDSPRLDLKQNPLYEDLDLAMMKTHYYGGIKKYQWLSRPLAFHGCIVLNDGETINITIGEKATDPVFVISDLLPHLARDYSSKKVSDAFEGEKLYILVGSIPVKNKDIKDRFKLNILYYLKQNYNINEEDFVSAEVEIVPAGPARDIGFDRGLIGAYGQDDRICAYTSLMAILETEQPEFTSIAVFFDKEEIGSEGSTGAQSRFLEDFISDLLEKEENDSSERQLRKILINATMLSGDVNAAIEPDYQEVHEKSNAARIGHGICITKFTGSGGKSGSSDANAEYVGKIRQIFNKNNIIWQTGELGKIDQGGGGTIAKYLAAYGMDIIDCGPALLSMHGPLEISGKSDVFMTYKAYKAFYENKGR